MLCTRFSGGGGVLATKIGHVAYGVWRVRGSDEIGPFLSNPNPVAAVAVVAAVTVAVVDDNCARVASRGFPSSIVL
jgi:hypothetical protein